MSIYLSIRSWAEYKDGFGDKDAEFWLGNDNLHYITAQGKLHFLKALRCLKIEGKNNEKNH